MTLAQDAESLFAKACRVRSVDGKKIACSALIRSAWDEVQADCGST